MRLLLCLVALVVTGCMSEFDQTKTNAEQGDPEAQYMLGVALTTGIDTPRNYLEAVEWITKAANQGNVDAQSELGRIYRAGEVITVDYDQSLYWFGEAAKSGDAQAQYELGRFYQQGLIVPRDLWKSRQWFKRSSLNGYSAAQYEFAEILITENLSQGTDNPDAVKWLAAASKQGHLKANLRLGNAYAKEYYGLSKNDELARKFISVAGNEYLARAIEGDSQAQLLWADLLFNYGIGPYVEGYSFVDEDLDDELALKWYMKAADQGNSNAMLALGAFHSNANSWRATGGGLALPSEDEKAFQWFSKAANLGNLMSMLWLEGMYKEGEGTQKDLQKSFEWSLRSAKSGWPRGQFKVSQKYFSGEGVAKDYIKAFMWASIAQQNEYSSQERVDRFIFKYVKTFPASDMITKLRQLMSASQVEEAKELAGQCFESLYKNCD
jgi:TPR repeat protein